MSQRGFVRVHTITNCVFLMRGAFRDIFQNSFPLDIVNLHHCYRQQLVSGETVCDRVAFQDFIYSLVIVFMKDIQRFREINTILVVALYFYHFIKTVNTQFD